MLMQSKTTYKRHIPCKRLLEKSRFYKELVLNIITHLLSLAMCLWQHAKTLPCWQLNLQRTLHDWHGRGLYNSTNRNFFNYKILYKILIIICTSGEVLTSLCKRSNSCKQVACRNAQFAGKNKLPYRYSNLQEQTISQIPFLYYCFFNFLLKGSVL